MGHMKGPEIGSPARLAAIETVRSSIQPNLCLVMVHGSDGQTGIGETFFGASSVDAYVHDVVAPILSGLSGTSPRLLADRLQSYVGYSGSGVEVRGNSAIDIALWDLQARRAGIPLNQMLGGPVRESLPVYNTCAGNRYLAGSPTQSTSRWGVGDKRDSEYEDLWAFLNEPARLAKELVDAGFGGMKVWPFDAAAEESGGARNANLDEGLRVLDQIRDSVGADLDLYLELHSLWTLSGAERLVRKLEPYGLAWVEDPVRPDHVVALSRLRASTNVPIAVGENVGAGFGSYKPLLDAAAMDVAILDLCWSGGVTRGLDTAAVAEQYGTPVTVHDCTGPVSLAVAAHFASSIRNVQVQEVARSFYYGWYRDIAEGMPELRDGQLWPTGDPGHGVRLLDSFLDAPTTIRRRSELE